MAKQIEGSQCALSRKSPPSVSSLFGWVVCDFVFYIPIQTGPGVNPASLQWLRLHLPGGKAAGS